MKVVKDPNGHSIFYLGPDKTEGPLPAFFYFALSGEESLTLPPYNHPILALDSSRMRIFSFTIPGHGEHFNKFNAMEYWAEQIEKGSYFLEDFFKSVTASISWLVEESFINETRMAAGGLSRGGFIATHIAALEKRISAILGFAPLTRLERLKEFTLLNGSQRLNMRLEELNLEKKIHDLTHLKRLRFYIGNWDMRVGTDACFQFIHKLSGEVHEIRARNFEIEMRITPSIGHKGHGTSLTTFEEGAEWIQNYLLEP